MSGCVDIAIPIERPTSIRPTTLDVKNGYPFVRQQIANPARPLSRQSSQHVRKVGHHAF